MTSLLRIKQIVGCKKNRDSSTYTRLSVHIVDRSKSGEIFSSSKNRQTHYMLARIRFTKTNEWREFSASISM